MSYQTAKWEYPNDKSGAVFSGGLVTNTSNTFLSPHFSPFAKNFRLDGASVINRPGHQSLCVLDGAGYPKGLFSYLRANSSDDRLVARQNVDATHKLVSVTEDGVATNILTNSDITSDNRMVSVNIGDDLYLMNGVDFGKLNGTTYTPISTTRTYSTNTIQFFSASGPFTAGMNDSAGTDTFANFSAGNSITITGSASNNKTITVLNTTPRDLVQSWIATIATDTLTNEAAGASVTLTSNAAQPSFGVFFAGCQWLGGFTGSGFTNQVWKSVANNPGDFTSLGSDVFTFPENVTGMVTTAQSLFVFTKNTVHVADLGSQVETAGVITFSFRPLQTTEGSTNHASLVAMGADVYYISPSNSINKIVRGASVYGFEVVAISERKYKGINQVANLLELNQTEVHGQLFPQENMIKWFFRTVGSTINDLCIVYDGEKDMFLMDTGKYFYDEVSFHGLVYAASNASPTLYIDEYGADDDGGGIDFVYWTKGFDEGEYTLKKCYWESRTDVMISPLASLTQDIYLNNDIDIYGSYTGTLIDTKTVDIDNISTLIGGIGTEQTGTFPVGMEGSSTITMYPCTILRTKGNLNKKGYSISFRYSSSVVGSQIRLQRLGYKTELLDPLATNLTI